MAHTPGPWHCGNRDNWWRIYDENGVYIAAAKDPSPAPNHKADGFDIEEANARLIAAAPELLKELEHARICLDFYDRLVIRLSDGRTSYLAGRDAALSARAVIAKAKGQS
jgi:hypothetical protein